MPPRLRSADFLMDVNIREAAELANRYQEVLDRGKAAVAGPGFDWYPYDTFGSASIFDTVLTGRHRWLRTLIGEEPVLDIGCGDGALSFFLESLGARVRAIDHVPTNFNRMQGVKALKSALQSGVRIHAADIDSRPDGAFPECGLALFLGILYHLKNPFGVLESLAKRARYCLLTTAITRYSTDQQTDVSAVPAAFLPGRDGLRGDETNFWIFTEAALRNLLDRTGWDVLGWQVVDDESSVLWGTQRDQRVACLLQSRSRSAAERSQLLDGWHGLENGAWRWTERRFSLWLAAPASIRLSCTAPAILQFPITIRQGETLTVIESPGDHEFEVCAAAGPLEFELDRALRPGAEDCRERGLIVRRVALRADGLQ